jgi:hypothetical protein
VTTAALHRSRCKLHAVRRMRERVDPTADASLIKRLSRIIKNAPRLEEHGKHRGGRKFFERNVFFGPVISQDRRRVTVLLDGQRYVVVYDKRLKTVVTVLPEEPKP